MTGAPCPGRDRMRAWPRRAALFCRTTFRTLQVFLAFTAALGGTAACGGLVASPTTGTDAGLSDASVGVDATSLDSGLGEESYPAACFIDTNNYDHSCSVDSDCVGALSGNYCKQPQHMCIYCLTETIAKSAVAQYLTDVSKTPLGSGAIPRKLCDCTAIFAPCCKSHYCVPGALCNGVYAD